MTQRERSSSNDPFWFTAVVDFDVVSTSSGENSGPDLTELGQDLDEEIVSGFMLDEAWKFQRLMASVKR